MTLGEYFKSNFDSVILLLSIAAGLLPAFTVVRLLFPADLFKKRENPIPAIRSTSTLLALFLGTLLAITFVIGPMLYFLVFVSLMGFPTIALVLNAVAVIVLWRSELPLYEKRIWIGAHISGLLVILCFSLRGHPYLNAHM